MSEIVNYNDTTPAADAGFRLGKWQKSSTPSGTDPTTGYPYFDVSLEVPSAGGVAVKTANYTAVAGDCGLLLSFNSSSPQTLTLPPAPPFAQWNIGVQNIGAGTLTVNRNSLDIDGAAANLTLVTGAGVSIATDGTNYFTERGATVPAVIVSTAGIVIDGGGSTPATGSKGFLQIPFAGTIIGWTLIADASGSASITVKKSTFAAFPTNSSIVASAPPALSSQQNATSATLTGWTTAVAAGDVLEFVLASATTVTRLILELQIARS